MGRMEKKVVALYGQINRIAYILKNIFMWQETHQSRTPGHDIDLTRPSSIHTVSKEKK